MALMQHDLCCMTRTRHCLQGSLNIDLCALAGGRFLMSALPLPYMLHMQVLRVSVAGFVVFTWLDMCIHHKLKRIS